MQAVGGSLIQVNTESLKNTENNVSAPIRVAKYSSFIKYSACKNKLTCFCFKWRGTISYFHFLYFPFQGWHVPVLKKSGLRSNKQEKTARAHKSIGNVYFGA